MTTYTDRTFGYCNQLMDRCPEHGPNVMGGIRYRRDFTQGIHSSVTSSPRGPVLATDTQRKGESSTKLCGTVCGPNPRL